MTLSCASFDTRIHDQLTQASWTLLETGSTESLRGICVVDDSVVWACGSTSTVLRSVDGGDTWENVSAPPQLQLELRDIQAWDDQNALALSITEPAAVWRTTDGGDNWTELFRHPAQGAFVDSFTFFDRDNGLLFGDPTPEEFILMRTSDGGESWTQVDAGNAPHAGRDEAAFAASGTCVVSHGKHSAWIGTGGKQTRVLCSTDAGVSWSAVASPMITGEATTGIYSVAFRDDERGVTLGGDYTKPEEPAGNAAFTTDGGVSWTAVLDGQGPRGHRAGAAWLPGNCLGVVAVGRAGCDYSVDGGATWAPIEGPGFYTVAFAPAGVGFAAGSDGRIARLQ
ncbi:MAG: photosystem II stability/assembly factor-like uncharacterized protein [Planctomycetota bacterium]|jgi:photosystem II stability/assembly factor-like uncharacterized protein